MRSPIPIEERIAITIWWLANNLPAVWPGMFNNCWHRCGGLLAMELELLSTIIRPGPTGRVSLYQKQETQTIHYCINQTGLISFMLSHGFPCMDYSIAWVCEAIRSTPFLEMGHQRSYCQDIGSRANFMGKPSPHPKTCASLSPSVSFSPEFETSASSSGVDVLGPAMNRMVTCIKG
ncbi:UNVERIFIED_CONTAM: hypothetical protein K2H54_045972 [Gekko kuhli]